MLTLHLMLRQPEVIHTKFTYALVPQSVKQCGGEREYIYLKCCGTKCDNVEHSSAWIFDIKHSKSGTNAHMHSLYTDNKSMPTDGRMFITQKNTDPRSEQSKENLWCTFCSHLASSWLSKLTLLLLSFHSRGWLDIQLHDSVLLARWLTSFGTQDLERKCDGAENPFSDKENHKGQWYRSDWGSRKVPQVHVMWTWISSLKTLTLSLIMNY